MKNVILGIYGIFLIVAVSMLGLCMYDIQARENEMNRCLSGIVQRNLEAYYVPEFARSEANLTKSGADLDEEVEMRLCREVEAAITSDSALDIQVVCCDMNRGILSVAVTETYATPFCAQVSRTYHRTAIVDRREAEK